MTKRPIPPAVSSGVSLVVGAVAVAASASRSLYAVALWAVALTVYTRSQTVAATVGAVAMAVAPIASRARPPTEVTVVGVVGASLLVAAAAPLLQRTIRRRRSSRRHLPDLLGALRRRLHPVRLARRVLRSAPAGARSTQASAAVWIAASRRGLMRTGRSILWERWAWTSAALQTVPLTVALLRPMLVGHPLGSLVVTVLAAACDVRATAVAVAGATFLAALLVAVGQRAAGEALAVLPFLTLLGLLVRLGAGFVLASGSGAGTSCRPSASPSEDHAEITVPPSEGARLGRICRGYGKLAPVGAALLLAAAPLAFWNDGKYFVGGDDSLLYYVYPLRMLKYYALNLAADNNLSTVTGYGQQLYLAPFLVLLALTKAALPGVNTQLLWYSINLAGGFLATFALLGEFRTVPGSRALGIRVAASFVYSVSVFSYFTVWSTQLFPLYLVVIYPLVSFLFLRAVRLRSVSTLVVAALLLGLFSIVILSTPWLLGMMIATLLPFLWVVAPYGRRGFIYGGLFAALTVLLNAHWISHVVNASLSAAKMRPVNLSFGAGDERLVSEVSIANTVLYPMLNLFHFGLLERFASANFPIYSKWSTRFILPNATLFALIPLAALRARRGLSRAHSLLVVTGLSWLLTMFLFTAQLGTWGVPLFLFLSKHVPGFVMFRNMYDKFGLAMALSSALVLFAALQVVAEKQPHVPWLARAAQWLIPAVAAILMAVEAAPFLFGHYYDQPIYSTKHTFRTVTELNHDFRDLTNHLRSVEESSRYAWLPLNAANYVLVEDEHDASHVYFGVSPLLFLSRKSDLSGQLSFGTFGPALGNDVLARDWVRVGELFQRFNVRFVIVNNLLSADLQQSYVYGLQARGDLYDAQQDPALPATLLGPKLHDFGRRYSLYEINPRFHSQRVSVRAGQAPRQREPQVIFSRKAPYRYDLRLLNVATGDHIQFLDPFNPQWQVVAQRNPVPLSHGVLHEYANQWRIDLSRLRQRVPPPDFVDHADGSADVRVQLRFRGQRLFAPAIATSVSTAAGCLLFLLIRAARVLRDSRRRRTQLPPGEPVASRVV